MADEIKTPIAIRVMRPFGSDDEFLEHEIDTLTRTTVTLLGAQSRPQGLILRFEITLATGAPLLRGEGRVIAFRPASQDIDAGLTLRFTRLDARSKALVDRAAAMRQARSRAASVRPPRMEPEPASPTPPEPDPTAPTLPEPGRHPAPPEPEPTAPTLTEPSRRMALEVPHRSLHSIRPQAPRRREELLDRLRQRAKTLSRTDVESLLASRPRKPAV